MKREGEDSWLQNGNVFFFVARRSGVSTLKLHRTGCFSHGLRPYRRGHFRPLYFFIDAGELPRVQPDAAAFRASVNLDPLQVREPFAFQDQLGATRAHPRFGQLPLLVGGPAKSCAAS